jgi:hypothetical protein
MACYPDGRGLPGLATATPGASPRSVDEVLTSRPPDSPKIFNIYGVLFHRALPGRLLGKHAGSTLRDGFAANAGTDIRIPDRAGLQPIS